MIDPTHAFKAPFLIKSITAAACAAILFGTSGLVVLRALGISRFKPTRNLLASWLLAPAIGMGTFGPVSIACLTVIGFSRGRVVLVWLAFLIAFELLARRRPIVVEGEATEESPLPVGIPSISNGKTITLILLAALWAVVPCLCIYPFIRDGGLFVDSIYADHVKIAMTDAIAREGLPLKNPFYAPLGKRILLSYSYGWYVLAAEVKKLSSADGWQTEVGLLWYTAFAAMTFLMGLASGLVSGVTGRFRAGLGVFIVACTGPFARTVLPAWFAGTRFYPLVRMGKAHEIEVPFLQFAWAPQHAFSALSVCMLVWLLAAVLMMNKLRWRYVALVGMVAAAGFDTSTWVGCVALLIVTPIILIAAGTLRLPAKNYLNAIKTAVPAAALCAALGTPLLLGLFSGPKDYHSDRSPIGLILFASTYLGNTLGSPGVSRDLVRVCLFWIQLLPLCFGLIYLLGLPAMIAWLPGNPRERTFRTLALAAAIGYLMVSLFVRSTIAANDLGWRAGNVGEMLMLVWAGMALAALATHGSELADRWLIKPGGRAASLIALALCLLILLPGLISTGHVLERCFSFDMDELPTRRLFAQQAAAWDIVRHHTQPTDLVQSNPDGFPDVTPWPINMPPHLFADRSMAYSCPGTGETYAFRYPILDNHRQYKAVQAVFVAQPTAAAIRALHDRMNVKAVVVTPEDPVWESHAFEQSKLYERVAMTDAYKVYVARTTQKSGTHEAGE